MSADPVTMMIISASVQTVGKLAEIKAAKEANEFRQYSYQLEQKQAVLKGEQDANDRKEVYLAQLANNKAVASGSGYDGYSPSFTNIQHMTKKISDKDISTIRLNTAIGVNKLSLSAQAEASATKAQVFGGYISIISTGITTKAKADAYGKTKTKKDYPTYGSDDDGTGYSP